MFKAAEGSRPSSRPEQRPPIAPAPASARARAPRPAAPPPPPPDVPARASHRRRVVRTRRTRRGCCTLPGKHTPVWANRQVRLKGYQRRALRVTAVRMSHAPQWRSTCKRVASKSPYRARSASQEADLSAEAVQEPSAGIDCEREGRLRMRGAQSGCSCRPRRVGRPSTSRCDFFSACVRAALHRRRRSQAQH